MSKSLDLKKLHQFQEKSGWCGPAVIAMVLRASGIRISQKAIAEDVYLPWWGTPNQVIIAYLSRYFYDIGFKNDATLADLEKHLKLKHIILV